MLYAHDWKWWTHPSHKDAMNFPGLKVGGEGAPKGVFALRNTGILGFDPDPRNMRVGGNSGFQAIHIAIHGGAKRVLLLGFDMHGGHWHGPHPSGLTNAGEESYLRWIGRFESLIPAIAQLGLEVINCTPGSQLKCFPMMSLEDALEGCQPAEEQLPEGV
jgi:hypothetical protein